jgi:catechol 2,3-dioxygenase-like lactoylglutathione lyase family enzyme
VAFYRDVLGFNVPEAYQDTDEFAIVDLRPGQGVHLKRGSAGPSWRRRMGVYVGLPHAALEKLAAKLAADGTPLVSPLADRPWGMREIHVADPEGHLLRFGADVEEHGMPGGGPARVFPEVPVADAATAAAFCRDVLGMGPARTEAGAAGPFQRSYREGVTLHWWVGPTTPFAPSLVTARNRARGEIWDVCVEVTGVDALAPELAGRGATIVRGPETTDYGIRELEIVGPDGCTICFGEDLGG